MRISEQAVLCIKEKAQEIFGIKTKVYLFGSRVDDTKKGGDIDLFLEPERVEHPFNQTTLLIARLKMALGEQKFDVVLATDPNRLIEQEARKTGVLL